MKYRIVSWKKYVFETLSIFIAVVSAFALNNWSQNLRDNKAEIEILKEVRNGITNDLKVIKFNKAGNVSSKKSIEVIRDLISNRPVEKDSLGDLFVNTFRDYMFTANTTGYKGLESQGLDIVKDNLLRARITYYYNYYFVIVDKIEGDDQYKVFKNYFFKFNEKLFPYMIFDNNGQLVDIKQPISLSELEKKELLSYLWLLEDVRKDKITLYEQLEEQLGIVEDHVNEELEKRV